MKYYQWQLHVLVAKIWCFLIFSKWRSVLLCCIKTSNIGEGRDLLILLYYSYRTILLANICYELPNKSNYECFKFAVLPYTIQILPWWDRVSWCRTHSLLLPGTLVTGWQVMTHVTGVFIFIYHMSCVLPH